MTYYDLVLITATPLNTCVKHLLTSCLHSVRRVSAWYVNWMSLVQIQAAPGLLHAYAIYQHLDCSR